MLAADTAYDTKDFVADAYEQGFTPHVAQNGPGRRDPIDGRTTLHDGCRSSMRSPVFAFFLALAACALALGLIGLPLGWGIS